MRSLLLMFALVIASPAGAWGALGHRTVAYEAEALLTPAARNGVRQLLSLEGGGDLASVATWADEIRSTAQDGPRHTVQLPLDHQAYSPNARYCSQPRPCLVKALDNDIAILQDRTRSDAERLRALKFVVHFVAEVHQPTHATRGKGRQWVVLNGRPVTINRLWQTALLKREGRDPKTLADKLMADQGAVAEARALPLKTPGSWAGESRDISRDFIYSGPYGIDFRDGRTQAEAVELAPDYAERATPLINQRLRLAGVRLAAVLNRAFD